MFIFSSFINFVICSVGSSQGQQFLDGLIDTLMNLAYADSSHRNMQSHLKVFLHFCTMISLQPFPIQSRTALRYIAFLCATGRSFGTVQNHISSLKHFNQFFGFDPGWDQTYSFKLTLRGCKRFLGLSPARKQPITPRMLCRMALLFDKDRPLHAAMLALFLVAFFSFLRKSNLVPDSIQVISPKVPSRSDLSFSAHGATLHIRATKTIQCFQRSLAIPLPAIPNSPLCPVTALNNHFRLNPVPAAQPLFSFQAADPLRPLQPLTYSQFTSFLSKVISAIGLDPKLYSPHSFRRGGASFAFECSIPAELIKLQGDWRSDAYLVYLEMSNTQKREAVTSMASNIQKLKPVHSP
jgi:hypothetical protein